MQQEAGPRGSVCCVAEVVEPARSTVDAMSWADLDEPLPWTLRVQIRWWAFRGWMRHCPECHRRGWDPISPRWDEDPVAHMLAAVTPDRCGACGHQTTANPHPPETTAAHDETEELEHG